MDMRGKKIGIWGFGIVGTSTLAFLRTYPAAACGAITILNRTELTAADKQLLVQYDAHFLQETPDTITSFLEEHEYIIVSPGIDKRPYAHYAHKFLNELDIFYTYWQKPIIAITGTVGKTSVTHLLSQLLTRHGYTIASGGNIGKGMLDLITEHAHAQYAVLELSSFQLEDCQIFAPDYALILNVFPNHLDRHGTFDAYSQAKIRIFKHQQRYHNKVLPVTLIPHIPAEKRMYPSAFFSAAPLSSIEKAQLKPHDRLYFFDEKKNIQYYTPEHTELLIPAPALPELSYPINWLSLVSILHMMGVPLHNFQELTNNLALPDHRLDCFLRWNDIEFYNDSKSTIPHATQAALTQCAAKPILLFLGGISKGVDRAPFIEQLPPTVKHIFCFGAEAPPLTHACLKHNKPASSYDTLETAVAACMAYAQPGDTVLFSPAGASFDLFKDYKERGEHFKRLVLAHTHTSAISPEIP